MNDAGLRGDLDARESGMWGEPLGSQLMVVQKKANLELETLRSESIKTIDELHAVIDRQASEIVNLKYQLDMLRLNEALTQKPVEGHTWTSTGPYMPLQLGADAKTNSSSASLFMAGDQ